MILAALRDVPDFPRPMAFGAVGQAEEVKHFAVVTTREGRTVGIQCTLAPVADVNNNPSKSTHLVVSLFRRSVLRFSIGS